MNWVLIVNDPDGYGRAYQLWTPSYPAVRTNERGTEARCAGLVHRIGESPMWRARASGSEHTRDFDDKEDAIRWIETQAKLMGFA